MGEYVDYLKAWFASKPTSFNVSSFVQLFKILIRGMEELENKNRITSESGRCPKCRDCGTGKPDGGWSCEDRQAGIRRCYIERIRL